MWPRADLEVVIDFGADGAFVVEYQHRTGRRPALSGWHPRRVGPVRRALIQHILPAVFCALPLLAALLVAFALPTAARDFYLAQIRKSSMDWLILGLGTALFVSQLALGWRAMQWRGAGFDERPDRWLSNLAQAAEWFPLLGLLGTVAGILQTFSGITGQVPPERIIQLYAPAITATGSGLFMALVNILPTWVVTMGRELILSIGGNVGATNDE